MRYRRLGSSDVSVSAITLGIWTIAHRVWSRPDGVATAVAIIDEALAEGITTIDTASTYGFGWCDEVIGKAVKGKRDQVQISAKYGQRWDRPEGLFSFDAPDPQGRMMHVMRNSRPDAIIEECEQILRRLQTDYIDLFQCHWPDPTTPMAESMGAVARLIEQGKVRAAGVSNFSIEQMDAANEVVALAATQSPYSMLDRRIEKDLVVWCAEHDVSVLAYSPLESGLLAEKIAALDEGDPRHVIPYFRPDNLDKIRAFLTELESIAPAYDVTIAQLVINWTIHRPRIASAICGALTTDHVAQNALAADFDLNEEDGRRIDELVEALEVGPHPEGR